MFRGAALAVVSIMGGALVVLHQRVKCLLLNGPASDDLSETLYFRISQLRVSAPTDIASPSIVHRRFILALRRLTDCVVEYYRHRPFHKH